MNPVRLGIIGCGVIGTFHLSTASKFPLIDVVAIADQREGNEDSAMIHAGPVTDFAQAIREKRQPKTSLENALVVQQITDAIYKSAKTGSVVEV